MKKYIKYIIILLVLITLPFIAKYTTSYAKYAYNSAWNYYLKSKGFYFNSNTINNDSTKVVNNLWDGGLVYFDLRNNLNDTVASENDINYKVSCSIKESSSSATCNLMDTNTDTYTGVLSTFKTCTNNKNDGVDVKNYDKTSCEIGGYTWENQPAIKNLYFSVDGSNVDTATIEITITSLSPYKKTLKREFVLNRDKNIQGSIDTEFTDKTDLGNLILSNSYDETKCIRINWNPEFLRIDVASNEVKNIATDSTGFINEIDVQIAGKSSKLFRFYKTNSNIYSKEDFTVTELENCN